MEAVAEPSGLVFNILRFCLHDGPGIRTTVFLKGCPLSCWWCHNPEGQSSEPELLYYAARCRRCGACVEVCPQAEVAQRDGVVEPSPLCERCGACVEVCVAGARELAGRPMSVSDVLREVERDLVFFEESGGGVTLSGGEPLQHPDFTVALLDACRARGVHTVLETCGMASREALLNAARRADLVLYDLKVLDPRKHREYTGSPNDAILGNLEALAGSGHPPVVRLPLIPGLNDGEADLREYAGFLARLGIRRVDVLPYHRIGIDKYRRLGRPYHLPETATADAEANRAVAAQFQIGGFEVTIGGMK
ncbi:MAG: glycyl-radical enzyme activating protein [Acidobacteria bacterium]|nr:glycyl-radical enzyme activating protein [Acidobacteriota bacterium]